MNNSKVSNQDDIWEKIEQEKRIDTWIQRFSLSAWVTTFILFICFAVILWIKLYGITPLYPSEAPGLALEIVGITLAFMALGSITFGLAIISTIGLFLRMRTSSLRDIQFRLKMLEETIITEKGK